MNFNEEKNNKNYKSMYDIVYPQVEGSDFFTSFLSIKEGGKVVPLTRGDKKVTTQLGSIENSSVGTTILRQHYKTWNFVA